MYLWIVGFAIVVFGGLAFVISKVRSLPVFYAAYDRTISQGGEPRDALESAIRVFARRRPFEILTNDDVLWLAETFSKLPDPKILGQVFLALDKAGDASGLRKRDNILAMVKELQKRHSVGGA